MNPILQAAIGSIIRWCLALLAGYLVKAGIWTGSDAQTYVAAGSLAILALGWSIWQKFRSQVKGLVASKLPTVPPAAVGLFLLCVMGLSSCATVPGADGTSPLASLQAFTLADLIQAKEIAVSNGDLIAAACWDALLKDVGALKGVPKVKGAFSAFEVARLGVGKIRGGISQEVHVACSPVVLDAQHLLIRLGLIGAGLPLL